MGLDPENDNFEIGNRCGFCEDSIFGGSTPKWVEAHFVNIAKCPLGIGTPPNQVFLLEQTAAPCFWRVVIGFVIVEFRLFAANSLLQIIDFNNFWFFSFPANTCVLRFNNQVTCGAPQAYGTGGIGAIVWGPTIGP